MKIMKTCSDCNKTKQLKEFQLHSNTIDGRLGKCKMCKTKEILAKRSKEGSK